MESLKDVVIKLFFEKGFVARFDDEKYFSGLISDSRGSMSFEYSLEPVEKLSIGYKDTGRKIEVLGKTEKFPKIVVFHSIETDDVSALDSLVKTYGDNAFPPIKKFADLTFRSFADTPEQVLADINEFEELDYKYVKNLRELMVHVSGVMGVYDFRSHGLDLVAQNNEYFVSLSSANHFTFRKLKGGIVYVANKANTITFYVSGIETELVKMEHRFARRPREEIVARDYNEILRFFKEWYKK